MYIIDMAYINGAGYIKISGERLEHVEVAKANPEICGEWFEGCCVHHINGIKTDNRPENLIVLSRSEHMKLHMTGKDFSDEHKQKLSKARKGRRGEGRSQRIMQFDKEGNYIKTFDSALIASDETGVCWSNIRKVCKGIRETAGGYIWKDA